MSIQAEFILRLTQFYVVHASTTLNKNSYINLVIALFLFKTIYTFYERFKVIDMII